MCALSDSQNGHTALTKAIQRSQIEIAKTLLKSGANEDHRMEVRQGSLVHLLMHLIHCVVSVRLSADCC